jgi:hypothetical protein
MAGMGSGPWLMGTKAMARASAKALALALALA